jgi:hypothetical protein
MKLWKNIIPKINFPPHINVTCGSSGLLEMLDQAKAIHQKHGEAGLIKYIRDSEKANGLNEGQFDFLCKFVREKKT